MRSHFIAVDGIRLHVLDCGGTGTPLLAVHGTGLAARLWEVLLPYLTPHFHVYALDRRGHGLSDKPEGGYQLEAAAPDYAAVVEHFDMRDAVALGHSSGGTSLGLAAALRPELFQRIAMLDPIIFPRRAAAGTAMMERTRKRRAEWPSAQEMYDSLGAKPPFNTWQPRALWSYVRHGTFEREDGSVVLQCAPALEARMYGHSTDLDLFEAFARVPVPVLIVRGEQTDRFPRAAAERAVEVLPDGRLVELPGLTHFLPMEDPARVADAFLTFLRTGKTGT